MVQVNNNAHKVHDRTRISKKLFQKRWPLLGYADSMKSHGCLGANETDICKLDIWTLINWT